jgi:hypothetical protein
MMRGYLALVAVLGIMVVALYFLSFMWFKATATVFVIFAGMCLFIGTMAEGNAPGLTKLALVLGAFGIIMVFA